jgi:hypothetical protein
MNEQPGQLISFLALMIFFAVTAYFTIFESRYPSKKKKSKDWMIPIGTVYDQRYVNRPSKPANLPKPPPEAQRPIIFDDCLLALMATGYKKGDARKITEQTFRSTNPKTVEEFIRTVFKK